MTELPRVLAMTTGAICRAPGYAGRVAALARLGPAFGIVVRAPEASASELAELGGSAAGRLGGSAIFIHGRPDIAAAVGADGVQLRRSDLAPADARKVFPKGWIGVSVHDRSEAEQAIESGADYLLAGNVFESTSHPGRPARGLSWLADLARLPQPVIAIGGITVERVAEVRDAGAWGIAVIAAIWDQADPVAAARALLLASDGGSGQLHVTVNGQPRRIQGPATLESLLRELELDGRAVVVELNRRIVRRPELSATELSDGDAVELVHFVGGG